MPKWEYEERQAHLRFPLLVSPILNFLHSHDDCFAACKLIYSSFAPDGATEDKAAGRCPPISRLPNRSRSFHFQFSV